MNQFGGYPPTPHTPGLDMLGSADDLTRLLAQVQGNPYPHQGASMSMGQSSFSAPGSGAVPSHATLASASHTDLMANQHYLSLYARFMESQENLRNKVADLGAVEKLNKLLLDKIPLVLASTPAQQDHTCCRRALGVGLEAWPKGVPLQEWKERYPFMRLYTFLDWENNKPPPGKKGNKAKDTEEKHAQQWLEDELGIIVSNEVAADVRSYVWLLLDCLRAFGQTGDNYKGVDAMGRGYLYTNLVWRFPWICLCDNGIWKMNLLIASQFSNWLKSRLASDAAAAAAKGVPDAPYTLTSDDSFKPEAEEVQVPAEPAVPEGITSATPAPTTTPSPATLALAPAPAPAPATLASAPATLVPAPASLPREASTAHDAYGHAQVLAQPPASPDAVTSSPVPTKEPSPPSGELASSSPQTDVALERMPTPKAPMPASSSPATTSATSAAQTTPTLTPIPVSRPALEGIGSAEVSPHPSSTEISSQTAPTSAPTLAKHIESAANRNNLPVTQGRKRPAAGELEARTPKKSKGPVLRLRDTYEYKNSWRGELMKELYESTPDMPDPEAIALAEAIKGDPQRKKPYEEKLKETRRIAALANKDKKAAEKANKASGKQAKAAAPAAVDGKAVEEGALAP
ncbi:hypothetical protein PENSPDRAFT_754861, partial [Peniophora sp. CONT]